MCPASFSFSQKVSLLAYHVLQVFVIFLADVFHQFPVQEHRLDGELPGFCIGLRIVDRVFDFQMSTVDPPDALDDV